LPATSGFTWGNFIEITKECNLECAVCFSESHPGAGGEVPLAEVVALARGLRAQGLCAVMLSGGEPTLHPQLVEIVRAIRRLGMDVTLSTNGLRLGREAGLARQLRRAGLNYLYLQMDTLQGEVCRRLRGGDYVAVKRQAMANLRAAGLRFGLTTTVVRDNLEEVGDLLRFAAEYRPHLGLIAFLAAAPGGRFTLGEGALVNREDIVAALVRSGAVAGLRGEHGWPFPRFAPFALDLHPDCAALIYLAATPQGLRPLDDHVDLARFYRLMRRARGRLRRAWGFVLLTIYGVLSVRLGHAGRVLRMALGTFSKRGRHSFLLLSVEHFLGRHYQDQERLDRCTTCNVRPDGRRVSVCIFEHPDARRSPDTRRAEAERRPGRTMP
jgi:pyruvate-formate lyase-activating enzyme